MGGNSVPILFLLLAFFFFVAGRGVFVPGLLFQILNFCRLLLFASPKVRDLAAVCNSFR